MASSQKDLHNYGLGRPADHRQGRSAAAVILHHFSFTLILCTIFLSFSKSLCALQDYASCSQILAVAPSTVTGWYVPVHASIIHTSIPFI